MYFKEALFFIISSSAAAGVGVGWSSGVAFGSGVGVLLTVGPVEYDLLLF